MLCLLVLFAVFSYFFVCFFLPCLSLNGGGVGKLEVLQEMQRWIGLRAAGEKVRPSISVKCNKLMTSRP